MSNGVIFNFLTQKKKKNAFPPGNKMHQYNKCTNPSYES